MKGNNFFKKQSKDLSILLDLNPQTDDSLIIESKLKRVFAEGLKLGRINYYKELGLEMKMSTY